MVLNIGIKAINRLLFLKACRIENVTIPNGESKIINNGRFSCNDGILKFSQKSSSGNFFSFLFNFLSCLNFPIL